MFALFAKPTASSNSGTSNSGGSDQSCRAQKPEPAPTLFQITSSPTTATLYFVPAKHATGYVVHYRTDTKSDEHSTSFEYSDSSGVIAHTIKDLLPNTKYYFKIQPKNGCATGDWSQESTTVTTNALGGTRSPHGMVSKITSRGDIEVVETKQEQTPKKESIAHKDTEKSGDGYDVVIKVQDNGKPVAGASVELHSTPRKTVTDKDGVARFTNVEGGDHTVYLAYNNYTGEEKIKLEGEDKQVDISITVTLKQNKFFLSNEAIAIICGLLVVITILLILLFKKRKKKHN